MMKAVNQYVDNKLQSVTKKTGEKGDEFKGRGGYKHTAETT